MLAEFRSLRVNGRVQCTMNCFCHVGLHTSSLLAHDLGERL